MSHTKIDCNDVNAEKFTNPKVTMYHDGECPLCKREVDLMKKLDIKKEICFVDITQEKSALDRVGITYEQAMAKVHVQDENLKMHKGVQGFLAVWQYLPYYRRLVPIINNVPLLLPLMEIVYKGFAKNRLRLTGKKMIKS